MKKSLVEQLISEGILQSRIIIEAFEAIDRSDFVDDKLKEAKGEEFIENFNAPLSIGFGQTISQPLTVAFMLELLKPEEGDKVLDVGAGSGWQTALLAHIVGEKGKVFAIEAVAELKEFGENNVSGYNFIEKKRVEFIHGDGAKGLASEAPFDKIIAAASAEELPEPWKNQLAFGGRLVAPVKNSIWLFIKKEEGKFEEYEYPGFSFVPLVEK